MFPSTRNVTALKAKHPAAPTDLDLPSCSNADHELKESADATGTRLVPRSQKDTRSRIRWIQDLGSRWILDPAAQVLSRDPGELGSSTSDFARDPMDLGSSTADFARDPMDLGSSSSDFARVPAF